MMAKAPFEVRHTPNPCNVHSSELMPKVQFPFMWFYRTEVVNNTDKTLYVTWFEGYSSKFWKWYPSNITGKTLTPAIFSRWYGADLEERGAIIAPKSKVICDVNWHGSQYPWAGPAKWVYKAIDDEGNEYFCEGIVRSKIVMNSKSLLWFAFWFLFIFLSAIYYWK